MKFREPCEIRVKDTTLDVILEKHKHWLAQDCEGWENMRAVLQQIDLSRVDLRSADLRDIVFSGTNLRLAHLAYADLSGAYLDSADLYLANLNGADLSKTDLRDASFHRAYLKGTNLFGANLRGANFHLANLYRANLGTAALCYTNFFGAYLAEANLWCADVDGANFYRADLSLADLTGVNLSKANLHGTYLLSAKNIGYMPLACPSEGAFIGWKKYKTFLIKLEIPEDAKRSSATGGKCRCDKAKVLDISNLDGTDAGISSVINRNYSPHITYTIGEMVYPDSFDNDRWDECSNGIHFFINKKDAIDY